VSGNGELLGVVVASLDPSYFEDVYRRVSLGQQGGLSLAGQALALRPIIQGTADFFALTASGKRLALQLSFAPDLPQMLVCDGLRLRQILNDLLSNALKFTAAGSVSIVVERIGA